jgi:hypothetical protein
LKWKSEKSDVRRREVALAKRQPYQYQFQARKTLGYAELGREKDVLLLSGIYGVVAEKRRVKQ